MFIYLYIDKRKIMERRNAYPIEIKAKVDLNTEFILNEFSNLVGKNKS